MLYPLCFRASSYGIFSSSKICLVLERLLSLFPIITGMFFFDIFWVVRVFVYVLRSVVWLLKWSGYSCFYIQVNI